MCTAILGFLLLIACINAVPNLQQPLQENIPSLSSPSPSTISKDPRLSEALQRLQKPLLHRPYTAEEIFFHKHVPKIRQDNPGISNAELGRKLGAQWYGKNEVRDTYDSEYHLGEGLTYTRPAYELEQEWRRRRIEHSVRMQDSLADPSPMPEWYCDDGTFDDDVRAPEMPQSGREWYVRSLKCEAIKEKRTGRESWSGTIAMRALNEWHEMSEVEKGPFEEKARLQKERYLDAWERYGEVAVGKKVPPWILPCENLDRGVSGDGKGFQRAFGKHMKEPPPFPRGFRSAYMIYYREKICDAVIQDPGKTVAEHGRHVDSLWNPPLNNNLDEQQSEDRSELYRLYESKFQEAKAKFLDEWSNYWTTATTQLNDADHPLSRDDLWRLKLVHAFGANALFSWDREYKWHAEDCISGMDPTFLKKSDAEWDSMKRWPGNVRKHYEDLEKEIRDVYEKATGLEWGDPHEDWKAFMRKTEL